VKKMKKGKVIVLVLSLLTIACAPSDKTYESFTETSDTGSSCGNGITEEDEACDGEDLKNFTCVSFGLNGTLSCNNSDCSFNLSDCRI
jgi:hypothetical protein